MYHPGQPRSSLSMVEEVLNGVHSSELEKLESDVDAIFNSTLNNSTKTITEPSG